MNTEERLEALEKRVDKLEENSTKTKSTLKGVLNTEDKINKLLGKSSSKSSSKSGGNNDYEDKVKKLLG